MTQGLRLKIKLLTSWREQKIQGPATYVRPASAEPGALQFSFAHHRAGPLQNTNKELLLGVCRKMASRWPGSKIVSEQSGDCNFGQFGTAIARGDSPKYVQVWVLSNTREFILVTHICESEPDPTEISEANEIALMTTCE